MDDLERETVQSKLNQLRSLISDVWQSVSKSLEFNYYLL